MIAGPGHRLCCWSMLNRKILTHLSIAGIIILTAHCQSLEVSKVDRSKHNIKKVCILENPDVIVEEFLAALQGGLYQRGIDSTVIKAPSKECAYTITYIVNQSWDFAMYISHITLVLLKGDESIGRGVYSNSGSLGKFGPVEEKLKLVLDPMFGEMNKPGT